MATTIRDKAIDAALDARRTKARPVQSRAMLAAELLRERLGLSKPNGKRKAAGR